MPTLYFRSNATAPGNWTLNTNWSTTPSPNYVTASAAPTVADDVVLESVSANVTVNLASATCKSLNASAYVRTLTLNALLTIAGDVTFNAGMTVSGVGSVQITATSSITTAGKTFSAIVISAQQGTVTLVDGITCSNLNLSPVTSTLTQRINNNFINVLGNLTYGNLATTVGTSVINLIGTGTWNHSVAGYLGLNVNVNGGNITLGNIYYLGTYSFLSGTVSAGTGTLFVNNNSATIRGPRTTYFYNVNLTTANLISNTQDLYISNNLQISAACSFTLGTYSLLFRNSNNVLSGNLIVLNSSTLTLPHGLTVVNATLGGASTAATLNGFNLFVTGNLIASNGSGLVTGSTVIQLIGTGSWTGVGALASNFIINTPGTINITGNVALAGSMTYSAGTVNSSTATLQITGNANLNLSGLTFGNLNYSSNAATLTLGSDINLLGNFTNINTNVITSSNRIIYVGGSFTCGVLTLTSTTVVMNGTGTIQTTNSIAGSGEFQINTNGTITISTVANFTLTSVRFTWISGSVNTGGTTAVFNTNTITSGDILWNTVNLSSNGANTLLSDMYVTNLITSQQGFTTVINGFSIYVNGNMTTNGTTAVTTGTTNIVLVGTGTVTNNLTSGTFRNNLEVRTKGVVTFSGNFRYITGTLQYTSGNIISTGATLSLVGASTVLGFNKVDFETVVITGGTTIAMDGFFSGRPGKLCLVQSTNTTNYVISFLDPFEKIATFVRVTNCTIAATSSYLLVATDGASTNITTSSSNSRIRYYNQSPNGVGRGLQLEPTRTIYLAGNSFGLTSDPSIT